MRHIYCHLYLIHVYVNKELELEFDILRDANLVVTGIQVVHKPDGAWPSAQTKHIKFIQNISSIINLSWPCDAMWRHRHGSTLAQVVACCLTAPNHYLKQCRLIIIKGVPWHSPERKEVLMDLISNICSEISLTCMKLLPHLPGADELMISKTFSSIRRHLEKPINDTQWDFVVLRYFKISRLLLFRNCKKQRFRR